MIRLAEDWRSGIIKRGLAWLGKYTLEIYVIHYHFAAALKPEGYSFTFWSGEGILYSVAAFVFMSAVTAALVYVIGKIPPLKFLLFGKK